MNQKHVIRYTGCKFIRKYAYRTRSQQAGDGIIRVGYGSEGSSKNKDC